MAFLAVLIGFGPTVLSSPSHATAKEQDPANPLEVDAETTPFRVAYKLSSPELKRNLI